MNYERYAVYYTPPQGPLADLGAAWLGWDPATGQPMAPPECAGLPRPAAEITRTPRKYGLHATVKPPFRLAEGAEPDGLAEALAAFCAARQPVTVEGLEVAALGRFLALRPRGETTALDQLAGAAVAALDAYRAPPGTAELARRRGAGLSPRQEALLLEWGYPYVMEEFRFHITLTGKLPRDEIAQVRTVLSGRLAPILPAPFVIDGLSLMGEDASGMFHLLHRYTFSG